MTQEQKILTILKNHPDGVHPSTLAFEAKITQYNARINGLRKDFGCECKNGYRCSGQTHIVNERQDDGTTKFFYIQSGSQINWEDLRNDAISKRDSLNGEEQSLFDF